MTTGARDATSGAPGASADSMEAARKVHVLLVDDHEDANELLRMLLARRGFAVITARSIDTAIACAESAVVDVLVSDIGLPDGTGHELLERLRERGPLPAIAISGLERGPGGDPTKDSRFDAHLRKPVAIDQLVDALHRVSGR